MQEYAVKKYPVMHDNWLDSSPPFTDSCWVTEAHALWWLKAFTVPRTPRLEISLAHYPEVDADALFEMVEFCSVTG